MSVAHDMPAAGCPSGLLRNTRRHFSQSGEKNVHEPFLIHLSFTQRPRLQL